MVQLFTSLFSPTEICRDAASLACAFKAAAAAALASKWRSAVRIGPGGLVLEPANGAFDVTVAPGANVQAAVDACPPGGCVLLLPGTYEGPLVLEADKEVHVFGRGRATLRTAVGHVLMSRAAKATFDGLVVRQDEIIEDHGDDLDLDVMFHGGGCGVLIQGGALRLQACAVSGSSDSICIPGSADPVIFGCRCGGTPLPRCLFVKSRCRPLYKFPNFLPDIHRHDHPP